MQKNCTYPTNTQLSRWRRIFIMYNPILVIKWRERGDVLLVIFELICYLCTYYRLLTMDDKNPRAIPKHIVFLFLSFLQTRKVGSKAVVPTTCLSAKWHSQPMMPGTKISSGNFLMYGYSTQR